MTITVSLAPGLLGRVRLAGTSPVVEAQDKVGNWYPVTNPTMVFRAFRQATTVLMQGAAFAAR